MSVYLSQTPSPTAHVVRVGPLRFLFSYETVVAFRIGSDPWVVSENVWSKTTGKHINQTCGAGARRIPHEEFAQRLATVLDRVDVRREVFTR
jgi:hypothetical protein